MQVGVCARVCDGRAKTKYEKLQGNKQGQCRDVPKRGATNVATLQRRSKSNVATLGSNIATFQRSYNPTSQCWDPTSRRSKEGLIQRHDILEKGKTDVATLKSNIATLQRRPKMQNFQQWSKVRENPPSAIGDSL